MKRETLYLIIIAVLFLTSGTGWFSSFTEKAENRALKQDELVRLQEMKRLYTSYDSLLAISIARNKQDSIDAIQDSVFVAKIQAANITTINANRNTIIRMPADSFLLLVSGFIND